MAILLGALLMVTPQSAAAKQLVREAMQFLESRFAREIAIEGAERVEARLAKSVERWGEETLVAARRVGPKLAMEAVEKYGAAGAKILATMGDDGARLLALNPSLAGVVERYGDRACQFVWRNKGVIVGATVMAAFISNPEPYLNGVKQLVAEPMRDVAVEAARRTNWTLVIMSLIFLGAIYVYFKKRSADRLRAVR